MTTKKYELIADSLPMVTSKPGETLTYETFTKGAKIELDAGRARELIEAGAIKDPSAKGAGEPGGETKAPKGKADGVGDGVGDGDAEAGTIGDGGPDPQGTGSTAPGDGGGPGDGQGSAADNPAASTARRGRASGGSSS